MCVKSLYAMLCRVAFEVLEPWAQKGRCQCISVNGKAFGPPHMVREPYNDILFNDFIYPIINIMLSNAAN